MKGLVVVTGVSSGIGSKIAETMSTNGYPILLLSRGFDMMEALNLHNEFCN